MGGDRHAEDPVRRGLGLLAMMLVIATLTHPSLSSGQMAGIMGTKHNLSSSGPGPIKALTETQVCVFCHTPHNANPLGVPLWNRAFTEANYTPYDSPSIQATIGQPTGASKLCLSCHDGTIAIGAVRNLGGRPTTVTGLESPLAAGSTLIGTVLTNDHPVSFVFDQSLRARDGELADPDTLTGAIRLKQGTNPSVANNVQCPSCHDPHEARLGKFLRKSPMGQSDNLCLTCHAKPGWVGSTHESDTFFYPRNQATTQVRDHSCFACHTPHTVLGAERLLRNAAIGGVSAIEETCYLCHQPAASGGIVMDIKGEFGKIWHHPITLNPGTHRPIFLSSSPLPENVQLSPGSSSPDGRYIDTKHVECVDCHNPHKVRKSNRTEGMRGIALDGTIVANVINDPNPADGQPSQIQYPICLRCHGDTFSTVIGSETATLLSGATPSNKRREFQTTNSAFHPIGGPGRNTSSNLNAQLAVNGLTVSSVIKCTDCHNSNSYEGTSGRVPSTGTTVSTPVGPHGSTYPSIRRARYENTLPGPAVWDPSNFNLCFRCHDVNKLTSRSFNEGAQTNFDDEGKDAPAPLANGKGRGNLHRLHLIDQIGKSRPLCKSCHYNIHSNVEAPNTQYKIIGVFFTGPPSDTPTHLVNFHPNVRPIGGRAKPEWEFDPATKERRCFLQCHKSDGTPGGAVMDGFSYRPPTGDLP